MTAWRFRGVLLPAGSPADLVVGVGDFRPLPGSYAIFGLVDAHCHVTVDSDVDGLPFLSDRAFADRNLAALAHQGVALLRDLGGASAITLDYARSRRPGLPIVLAAGRFHSTAERYFPRMYSPCEPLDLNESIRTEVEGGASWIKIIADFPRVIDGEPSGDKGRTYDGDVLADAVRTAHSLGARVAAHSTMSSSDLVAMGVDSIEHGNDLTETDLRALGARGGAWTPTIGAVVAAANHIPVKRLDALRDHFRQHLPAAISAGVTVMAGSDAAVPLTRDIALLAEHGLSPIQAIEAATVAARTYLGAEPSGDLVTYDHDPRDDPAVLYSPSAVVLSGTRLR